MSAQNIFDNTPLGSIIRYSDGAPKPPARFTRKLEHWERSNGSGRLIRKSPGRDVGNHPFPASFTLHECDFGGGGVLLIVLHRSFSVDTRLRFEVSNPQGQKWSGSLLNTVRKRSFCTLPPVMKPPPAG